MKKTIATCVWASLAALLLGACGGEGFLGDRNEALERADAGGDGANSAADATGNEGSGSTVEGDPSGEQSAALPGVDDAAGDTDADTSAPASDDGEEPNVDGVIDPPDTTEPVTNDTGASGEPDPAFEPTSEPGAADDDADTETEPDESDPTDLDPTDLDPNDPSDPNDPNEPYDACAGKSCGEDCNSCPPDSLCLSAPGYCNSQGECSPDKALCEPSVAECPALCSAPAVCQLCDDGETCARPVFECNADGSCAGISEWQCPEPATTVCPEECPVIEICNLCEDGSCAEPIVACNQDGSCGDVTWECPAASCETAAQCGEYTGVTSCIDCATADEGEAAQALPPEEPLPPSAQCTHFECIEKVCTVKAPSCEYDPCAGKVDGDSCNLCPPNDPTCGEIGVLKVCEDGKCVVDMQVSN